MLTGHTWSDEPLTTVNEKLENAKLSAYELGADKSIDPFMTLSFLSLPVIPSLRITTKGVFDAENWKKAKLAVILIDEYGNEKKLVLDKKDFK